METRDISGVVWYLANAYPASACVHIGGMGNLSATSNGKASPPAMGRLMSSIGSNRQCSDEAGQKPNSLQGTLVRAHWKKLPSAAWAQPPPMACTG